MGNGSGRIHSMDALRASTMFLLVPVHAAGLLSLNGFDGPWATAIYWLVHVFRLPLFFAMSGFFLALLLARRGPRRTVRNRSVRILVPLAVALCTLVPLMILVAQLTGIALSSGEGAPQGSPFRFEPSFLWFLWYLLIIDTVAVGLYALRPQWVGAAGRCLRRVIDLRLGGIALLAVPTAAVLWSAPTWTAEPNPTFVPEPAALAYYSLFFVFGATLCAHRELVTGFGRDAWRWAAWAVAATVPAALLFAWHMSSAESAGLAAHLAGLLTYAVATWASLLALVGLADRHLNRPRPTLRYLADASYWIYLSHMPAVVLIVALLDATMLGAAPRLALVTAGALAFSLATYAVLVRYTVIGQALNGRRRRPSRRDEEVGSPAALGGVTG